MKIYATDSGIAVRRGDHWVRVRDFSFDRLFRERSPAAWLRARLGRERPSVTGTLRPPLESQEVWAAGVTYSRSRRARVEESAHEATVYDRVYRARRPELFFKATPHRVVGDGGDVRIRRDSRWNVPEPELALAINRYGTIFGCTIGNDMSSRSIEGENPLYLPQAKIHDGCCALGPCLVVAAAPLAPTTGIQMHISRASKVIYSGAIPLSKMRRSPGELVEYLVRDNSFPDGCYLLTGTGIVPERDFTLRDGDVIEIRIDGIGTLTNRVRRASRG
jgi:2-dehydro-3-deoxy-D-arabinonate dehydratase